MRTNENRAVIWKYMWKPLCLVAVYHLGWVLLPGLLEVPMPSLLWELTVLAGVAASSLVFATNHLASHRFSAASRLWDTILLCSRQWAGHVLATCGEHPVSAGQQRLIYRQVAWCYQLRRQLTPSQATSDHQWVARLLEPAEATQVPRLDNPALQLLANQAVAACRDSDPVEAWQLDRLSHLMEKFICLQGECEQLNDNAELLPVSGPGTALVALFLALLPLGLLAAFHPTGPLFPGLPLTLSLLVSTFFVAAERRGALSQNPFNNPFRPLPLTVLCEDLEREMRQLLDEASSAPGWAWPSDALH